MLFGGFPKIPFKMDVKNKTEFNNNLWKDQDKDYCVTHGCWCCSVIQTLSSFNLYEDAIREPVEEGDELSDAIVDPSTQ